MAITDQYNGWEIFNEIPSGWKIDKTVGSLTLALNWAALRNKKEPCLAAQLF